MDVTNEIQHLQIVQLLQEETSQTTLQNDSYPQRKTNYERDVTLNRLVQ